MNVQMPWGFEKGKNQHLDEIDRNEDGVANLPIALRLSGDLRSLLRHRAGTTRKTIDSRNPFLHEDFRTGRRGFGFHRWIVQQRQRPVVRSEEVKDRMPLQGLLTD